MSGSSSSGRSYTGGVGGYSSTPVIDCSNLSRSTHILSPTMSFFSSQSIGNTLNVNLDEDETVFLVNNRNEQVGGLNPTWITELIDCLKKGKEFEAVISKIEGALISVNIKSI